MRHAAGKPADDLIGEIHETFGDLRFFHDGTGQHEKRYGQKREGVEAGIHVVRDGDRIEDLLPEHDDRRHTAQSVHDGQAQQDHAEKQQNKTGDHARSPPSFRLAAFVQRKYRSSTRKMMPAPALIGITQ